MALNCISDGVAPRAMKGASPELLIAGNDTLGAEGSSSEALRVLRELGYGLEETLAGSQGNPSLGEVQ